MKYLLLIIFSMTLAVSNAQTDSTPAVKKTWYYQYPKGPKVDTLLKPYVDMFLSECKKAGVSTNNFYKLEKIMFSTLPESIVGVCIPQHKTLYIDALSAKSFPDAVKIIIFHELGHCVLGLAHIPEKNGLAIMNPELDLQNPDKYYKNWETLIIMLFSDLHPKIKDSNQCCPDIIEDPCTHN